eukprot:g1082.t1
MASSLTAALGGSQNKAWANDANAFGRKMLEKMGWKDGAGLGKDEQGEKTHVRIKKRSEKLALGQEGYSSTKGGGANGMANRIDAYAGQKSWMETHNNFAGVLAGLSAEFMGEHEKKKKKKDKKDKKKKKRKQRKEKTSQGPSSDDGSDGSDTKNGREHAMDAFSFRKKNIRNKRVNGLSEKDLACLLGGAPSASPARAGGTHVDSNKKKKKKKKDKKKKKRKRDSGSSDETSTDPAVSSKRRKSGEGPGALVERQGEKGEEKKEKEKETKKEKKSKKKKKKKNREKSKD